MTNKLNEERVTAGLIGMSCIVFLICVFSCKEDLPDPGKIEYALLNTSQINVGFKVRLIDAASASLVSDSVVVKPGEELVFLKAQTPQEPVLLIKVIEIWNGQFTVKYKDINLKDYNKVIDRYTLPIRMPNINTSEITKFNASVNLYMNKTQLYGFYPKVDYPRTTYFFNTSNYFDDVFKIQTPTGSPNADFKIVDVFGSTMIGYDGQSYADKVLFIKSNNGGVSWQTFFEFGFSTSDDVFTTNDFINENSGWLFNYKIVFNGQSANTYATDVYRYSSGSLNKISTLNNYCVHVCKFMDENVGYVLANTSNTTLPSDTHNTYFMKTTDGGLTWSVPVVISNIDSAYKLFKLDNGKIIVFISPLASLNNYYLVSTDDGQTWQKESMVATKGIRDIYFLSNGTGYLKTGIDGIWSAQNIGEVYKTTNGGASWTLLKENINGSIIWFYDENIGYLQDLIYRKGQILYETKDGGINWKEVLYPYDYLIK